MMQVEEEKMDVSIKSSSTLESPVDEYPRIH